MTQDILFLTWSIAIILINVCLAARVILHKKIEEYETAVNTYYDYSARQLERADVILGFAITGYEDAAILYEKAKAEKREAEKAREEVRQALDPYLKKIQH